MFIHNLNPVAFAAICALATTVGASAQTTNSQMTANFDMNSVVEGNTSYSSSASPSGECGFGVGVAIISVAGQLVPCQALREADAIARITGNRELAFGHMVKHNRRVKATFESYTRQQREAAMHDAVQMHVAGELVRLDGRQARLYQMGRPVRVTVEGKTYKVQLGS